MRFYSVYLIKIELRHDSLKWICDARDILAQNVLEKEGYHNYHRAEFHFDLINFLRCSVARISSSVRKLCYFLCNFLLFVTKFRSARRGRGNIQMRSNEQREAFVMYVFTFCY